MYILELQETEKLFSNITYYHSIYDGILQDVKIKDDAKHFFSESDANIQKHVIERNFDYKCKIIELK